MLCLALSDSSGFRISFGGKWIPPPLSFSFFSSFLFSVPLFAHSLESDWLEETSNSQPESTRIGTYHGKQPVSQHQNYATLKSQRVHTDSRHFRLVPPSKVGYLANPILTDLQRLFYCWDIFSPAPPPPPKKTDHLKNWTFDRPPENERGKI